VPGERLDHRAFQLGLLQAPIFQREQIDLGDRCGRAVLLANERFETEHLVEHRLGHLGEPAVVQLAGMSAQRIALTADNRGRIDRRRDLLGDQSARIERKIAQQRQERRQPGRQRGHLAGG